MVVASPRSPARDSRWRGSSSVTGAGLRFGGAAFICFALIPDFHIPFLLIILILAREIFVTLLRIIAMKKEKPLKTERLGKVKTAVQMVTINIILILLLIKKIGLSLHPEIGIESGFSGWIELFGRTAGLSMYYTPLILYIIY